MNISQLECFLAVAGHLSFARAAEELNISQPAASHQIRALEDELGGSLFIRSTRTVKLTEEGRAFLADAERIVAIAKLAAERFERDSREGVLPFTVGMGRCMDRKLPIRALSVMKEKDPGLRPSLLSVEDSIMTVRVEDGTADAAIGFRDNTYRKEDLKFRELGRTCLCLVYDKKSFSRAKDAPLIITGPQTLPEEIASAQEKLAAERKPSDRIFCDLPADALTMAEAGLGCALLPEIAVSGNCSDGESDLGKEKLPGEELIWGVYFRSNDENPVIRRFLKALKDCAAT